jgi:hypothetical protein
VKTEPKNGQPSPYQTKFGPRKILASQAKQTQFAYILAALALCFAAISPHYFLHKLHQQENIIVLDGSGTMTIGPIERLNATSPLFTELVLQASKAMFERSKVGLENPELVTSLFTASAIAKLNDDVRWQLPDLQAKDLRQHATIEKINVIRDGGAGKARFYRLEGQINSAGMVGGSPISYTEPLIAILSIVPNSRIADRARYPFLVADFRIDQPPRPPGVYQEDQAP